MKPTKKRKDSYGRTWVYNTAEGTYCLGKTLIGCGAKNKSKWSIWSGPYEGEWEFNTLREAMEYCWSPRKEAETITSTFTPEELGNLRSLVQNELEERQKTHRVKTLNQLRARALKENCFCCKLFDLEQKLGHQQST